MADTRTLADDIRKLEERLASAEAANQHCIEALKRDETTAEERLELYKTIRTNSTTIASFAETLSRLLALYHHQHSSGIHHGARVTSISPSRNVRNPAEVLHDARDHHIKMYVDNVFVPSTNGRHDPELRPLIAKALQPLIFDGTLWYQTQWSTHKGNVGVLIEFKVLPDAAAQLGRIFTDLGACGIDVDCAPDPEMWHGKPYVSRELRQPIFETQQHLAKGSPVDMPWDTSSDVSNTCHRPYSSSSQPILHLRGG